MSKLSRRSFVTTAAALAVPAVASGEDRELLALGVEFHKVADEWLQLRKIEQAQRDEHAAP